MTELTKIEGPDTSRRMGRPPLSLKSDTIGTKVRITDETRQRIEALAGPNRMAVFIRDAIDEKLARDEKAAKRK